MSMFSDEDREGRERATSEAQRQEKRRDLAEQVLRELNTDFPEMLEGIQQHVSLNVVRLTGAHDRCRLEIECNAPDEYRLREGHMEDSRIGAPSPEPVGKHDMVRRVLSWLKERPLFMNPL
jgi:hypothetical protein